MLQCAKHDIYKENEKSAITKHIFRCQTCKNSQLSTDNFSISTTKLAFSGINLARQTTIFTDCGPTRVRYDLKIEYC